MKKFLLLLGCMVFLYPSVKLHAQEGSKDSAIPSIQQMRTEENYAFLNENDSAKLFLKPLKWIPISPKKNIYLTLGGQYRPRVEYFSNKDYTSENQRYYSQRLALSVDLKLGQYFRVFGELYHGATGEGKDFSRIRCSGLASGLS